MTTAATLTPQPARETRSLAIRPAYWFALVLLIGCAFALRASLEKFKITLHKEAIYPESRRLLNDSEHGVPQNVPPFTFMTDKRERPEVEEELGTHNYATRSYYLDNGNRPDGSRDIQHLEFHAAYYTGMIDTVPHVADRCFVGAGMLIDQRLGDIPIPLDHSSWSQHPADKRYLRVANNNRVYVTLPRDPEGIALRTTRFLGPNNAVVYAGYFFVANGGWVSRAEDVRLLAFDRKAKYAYYLKIQFSSDTVSSGEELAALAAKFMDRCFADILLCVPDWVRVEQGLYPSPASDLRPRDEPAVDNRRNAGSK